MKHFQIGSGFYCSWEKKARWWRKKRGEKGKCQEKEPHKSKQCFSELFFGIAISTRTFESFSRFSLSFKSSSTVSLFLPTLGEFPCHISFFRINLTFLSHGLLIWSTFWFFFRLLKFFFLRQNLVFQLFAFRKN